MNFFEDIHYYSSMMVVDDWTHYLKAGSIQKQGVHKLSGPKPSRFGDGFVQWIVVHFVTYLKYIIKVFYIYSLANKKLINNSVIKKVRIVINVYIIIKI